MSTKLTPTGELSSQGQAGGGARVSSVDALRGLVMIIMALDHTRDYFHAGAMTFSPEDLTRTNAALFFTRWVTHICAPVFMFTAGIGAYYWAKRGGRSTAELSRFLVTRGLWLVVLEITALRLIMNFGLREGPVLLTILWALGWSMIGLGALVWLPPRALAAVSLAAIALHNLTDGLRGADIFGSAAWLWNVLHQPGLARAGDPPWIVAYPIIPWVFVMAAGYCFGEVMMLAPEKRRQWLLRLGLALTAGFIVLRAINLYGDPLRWSSDIPGMTLLSFLRTAKYPPSLLFLLMTLGPALLLLAWMDGKQFYKTNPLIVFGRTPFFYFLAHFTLIHLLAFPFALAKYGRAGFLWHPMPSVGGSAEWYPPGFGYSLATVYAVWIIVVIAMYPLCRWYAKLKERRRVWWLSYL